VFVNVEVGVPVLVAVGDMLDVCVPVDVTVMVGVLVRVP
jgi:hypothetical protein